jgi:nanoRNase/pAp phosphatase (c-di-AMP/oligoRNAs hydrolase)
MQVSSEMKDRCERMTKRLKEYSGVDVFIPFDLDSAGGALGFREFAQHVCGEPNSVKIYYAGDQDESSQSRNVFSEFKLANKMEKLDPATYKQDPKRAIVFIDFCNPKDKRFGFSERLIPDFVIDHHGADGTENYSEKTFILNEAIGSASTLVVEMLFSIDYKFDSTDAIIAAKSLALGGYTDTLQLLVAHMRDLQAHMEMRRFFRENEFRDLATLQLSERFLDHWAAFIGNRSVIDQFVVGGIGFIKKDDRSSVFEIANQAIRSSSVNLVAVWAVIDDQVHVVVRSEKESKGGKNLDTFLKKCFGSKFSGGRLVADFWQGGAQFPLDKIIQLWNTEGKEDLIQKQVDAFVKEKIFH